MHNYVVTAYKPTSVSLSVVGAFTGPSDYNLIIGKGTRLEIFKISRGGLQPVTDVSIYGRVSALLLFRLPNEQQDVLFVLTEWRMFCLLSYDTERKEIVTRSNGNLQDRVGRPAEISQVAIVDPTHRMIGLHFTESMFKVIHINEQGRLVEAVDIRLEEYQVLDIVFLHCTKNPTIAVLHHAHDSRHVRTYEVVLSEKEFVGGPWSQANVEHGSSKLIPVPAPFGGVLIIGESMIGYHNGTTQKCIPLKRELLIKAHAQVDRDGSRFLIGDQHGMLHILVLQHSDTAVLDLSFSELGPVSIPATLNYLDNGFVFVGSCFGDSQLVRLVNRPAAQSHVEVVQTFQNLGPIVDFCVVDLERHGQGQLVTCSGAFKDGSLRIVRNSIGINEQAVVELEGIKGLWALTGAGGDSAFDKYLVVSFVGETRVLCISDDELDEVELDGFVQAERSVHCGDWAGGAILQATASVVQLVDKATFRCLARWSPPPAEKINLAASTATQAVVALGGGVLVLLEQDGAGGLREAAKCTLPNEVSAISLATLPGGATVALVGLWTELTINIIRLPELTVVTTESLGGDVIPRSVLACSFDDAWFVLCGLGDGTLMNYRLDTGALALSSRKKISLGTKPVQLGTFSSKGRAHVFAASDRPTIIHSRNGKLLYSNLDSKEVNYMCPFNAVKFPDSLSIASEGTLRIGTIDDIQKLHIRTVHLHEMPRRIAHQAETHTFALATLQFTHVRGKEQETAFLRLVDDQTFTILASYELEPQENPLSLISLFFSDGQQYYVLGTAYCADHDPEPSKGRILVFSVADRQLKLHASKEVRGAVYSLEAFSGKLLAGVNNNVHLLQWGQDLVSECEYHEHVLVLYLKARGDFVVVGDIMRSINLIMYNQVSGQLELISRDYSINWMSSLEIIDDDVFIGAEHFCNLFTVKKNSDAATDEERAKLDVVGRYHLGEFVNCFRHGSLVMNLPGNENMHVPTIIYASVTGAIGVIASLPQKEFEFMKKVEENMTQVVRGVGGFDHGEWRSFRTDSQTEGCCNFVDGDLVEMFFELPREKADLVASSVGVPTEDLWRRIEALGQAIH
mmetsp:Transcript_6838/g.17214  ORF Transcript_6838/g.17214 Transcript_6838/m.17214 type:complete len:1079 (-) Transcript_6838:121-3357(-)